MTNIFKSATVSPAWGRDYKSRKEAEADFRAGKDFRLHNADGKFCDTYCSIRDMAPGVKVEVRYKRLEQLVFVTV
jgi:hypothetical protein